MPTLRDITTGAINKDDIAAQIASMQQQLNEWGRLISNESRTKIIKDDSGTQRFLEGYQRGGFSNGDVGVKVSQVGTDVATATDDELIWSTDFNLFKIVDTGTLTIPAATVSQTGTNQWNGDQSSNSVAHSLGYTPAIIAFSVDDSGNYTALPFSYHGVGSFNNPSWETTVVSADSTNVYGTITATMFSGTLAGSFDFSFGPYTVKYFLLRETAN